MRQVEGTFELCQHPIMISNEFFLAVTSSFMKKNKIKKGMTYPDRPQCMMDNDTSSWKWGASVIFCNHWRRAKTIWTGFAVHPPPPHSIFSRCGFPDPGPCRALLCPPQSAASFKTYLAPHLHIQVSIISVKLIIIVTALTDSVRLL